MKILILLLAIFTILGCSKSEEKKIKKPANPKIIKKEIVKKEYRELKNYNYEGIDFNYKRISIKIPKLFIEKPNNTFFMNNGINLTFSYDQIDGKIEDYVSNVFIKLKKEYIKMIKDPEIVTINGREVTLMKYVLDRKKYFIEIYSVLIKENNNLYIVNISGKKKDMIKNNDLIIGIFASIKLQQNN